MSEQMNENGSQVAVEIGDFFEEANQEAAVAQEPQVEPEVVEEIVAVAKNNSAVSDALGFDLDSFDPAILVDKDGPEIYLLAVVCDMSFSMVYYWKAVLDGVNHFVDAFRGSAKKDFISVAEWMFNENVQLVSSFKPLSKTATIGNNWQPDGSTAMNSAIVVSCTALLALYKKLREEHGRRVKVIYLLVSDGGETENNVSLDAAKGAIRGLQATEAVKAFVLTVGDGIDGNYLVNSLELQAKVFAADADEKSIRKEADLASKQATQA